MRLDSSLPSDEWQHVGVHWHAIAETRDRGTAARTAHRVPRRNRTPDAVLRDPWAVASWIDTRTREHVQHREVHAGRDGIYSESRHHDLYVEAVTDEQCSHGCVANDAGHRAHRA